MQPMDVHFIFREKKHKFNNFATKNNDPKYQVIFANSKLHAALRLCYTTKYHYCHLIFEQYQNALLLYLTRSYGFYCIVKPSLTVLQAKF